MITINLFLRRIIFVVFWGWNSAEVLQYRVESWEFLIWDTALSTETRRRSQVSASASASASRDTWSYNNVIKGTRPCSFHVSPNIEEFRRIVWDNNNVAFRDTQKPSFSRGNIGIRGGNRIRVRSSCFTTRHDWLTPMLARNMILKRNVLRI